MSVDRFSHYIYRTSIPLYLYRVMYVDRYTIRLLGKQIPHGNDRQGFPVVSQIDRRRQQKKPPHKNNWYDEFVKSGKSIKAVELEAAAATADVSKLEGDTKRFKEKVHQLSSEVRTKKKALAMMGSHALSEPHASTEPQAPSEPQPPTEPHASADPQAPSEPQVSAEPQAPTEPQVSAEPQAPTEPQAPPPGDKDPIWEKKQELRQSQKEFLESERQLRERRTDRHQLNMMAKAAQSHSHEDQEFNNNSTSTSSSSRSNNNSSGTSSSTNSCQMTKPSLSNPRAEDEAKFIDISDLQASDKVELVFGGTDYGLCTLSKTVPLTTEIVQAHMNRFCGKCLSNKMLIMKGVNNSLTRARFHFIQ